MDFPGNLTPAKRHADDIADVLVTEVGDIGKTEVRRFDLFNAFTKYAPHGQKMTPFVQDASSGLQRTGFSMPVQM